jgi:hypothetical protein
MSRWAPPIEDTVVDVVAVFVPHDHYVTADVLADLRGRISDYARMDGVPVPLIFKT